MKLLPFLDRLAATPAATGNAAPRRALLQQAGRAALAALPLALGTTQPVAARTQTTAYDAITQLLQLERLQMTYYSRALTTSGLIPAAQVADFQRLYDQQLQHVALLQNTLQTAGALVPAVPAFDFSGRKNVATNPVLFPNVLSNYDDFLALAQQLEDFSVRLYTTYAFINPDDAQFAKVLLRMLAVEGEHSAHVRGLRRDRGVAVKTWPSSSDAPIVRPAAAQALAAAATAGEDNLTQLASAGVPIVFSDFLNVFKFTSVPDASLAEAFDEPVVDVDTTKKRTPQVIAQAALDLFS
ncbi:ferritin-like domain-containing protein [Hymenobacter sp. DH14]|uniref:Ferritin-like domain-containing protein n=1 Tax=Hymenobacter cyanobacteriorum TaxID=2926463 RepID=A0A9X2AJW1_9BACT|nr:ferritin-like domain-containing protein [Hymenobacter cyanobacteriorum]MCI1190195.1 ferritin-like domain-containing protein [Hymenobacter cyanobacteriorum]